MKTALTFLLLITLSARATELDAYRVEAAQNNPALEAAFNNWKAALEKVPQAQSLPDPRFSYSYFIEQVETRVGPQRQRFGISQAFPWFGTLKLRGGVAMEAAEAQRQHFEQARLNLFYRVTSAYCEYSYLRRSIDTTRQHLMLLQSMEQVARTRFEAGNTPQSALIQLQVELGKMEDRLNTLSTLRAPLSANLVASLNRQGSALLPWPQPTEPTPAQFTDADAEQWLRESSPQLRQADALIRKEQENAALARKGRYPDIMLGVSYIQTDPARMPNVSGSGDDPIMATVSVSLPIWFSKQRAAEREASLRRTAAEQLRADSENQLTATLQMTLYQFRDAERKTNLYQNTLLPKAEQALETARKNFEAGSIPYTALLEAERSLLEFQLAADRARADREIRLAKIEMLTGKRITP